MDQTNREHNVSVSASIACLDEGENIWEARVTVTHGDEPESILAERKGFFGREKALAWADRECEDISKEIVSYIGVEPYSTETVNHMADNEPG